MPEGDQEILKDAIARNAAVVMSLPSAGMLRHQKTRFLAETAEGIWLEYNPAETVLIEELIRLGHAVGISFKVSQLKTAFAVPLLRMDPQFAINATVTVPAVLTPIPASLKSMQRRSNYRVRAPEGSPLSVRAWRIPDHAVLRDRPLASMELKLTVRDISVGGLGVILQARNDEPLRIVTQQRLRIELRYGEDIELVLDGTLKHKPDSDNDAGKRVGIQFKKLESDLNGRQALAQLTRIVGELQREEVRRARLGLAS